MKAKAMKPVLMVLIAVAVASPAVWAKKKAEPTPLTATGEQLEARYTKMMESLKAELTESIPEVSEAKKAAYLAAREAEEAAVGAVETAKKNFAKLKKARALVNHAKGKWIGGAERGIAKAEKMLKQAKTEAEKEAAEKEMAKWQKNKQNGLKALKERQARLDEALRMEPEWTKQLEAAKKALTDAKEAAMEAFEALGVKPFLASDKANDELVKYIVLYEATPRGLAMFAQQSAGHRKLVQQLLSDVDLMEQMLIADGAEGGNYGQAMKIYTDIQAASDKADEGTLQRLALGISLLHAEPIRQRNPRADKDAPKVVDPVHRYLHYEKAFLNGELDPAFKDMTAWEFQMVVQGSEPDWTLAWGREMLRTYRPDHITNPDYRWRYVGAVRTDIRYGSQYNKYDKPEMQFFQNILMNGGVCGRRAFFGRFMLRAFGIPTTARPQRGHAALAHWTPDGWVICLGGGWGAGWTKGRYNKDLDFLANTQARESENFREVKRAQWVGDVKGEKRVFGFVSGDPEFWYGISLYRQREIIEELEAKALEAVGTELGEANDTEVKHPIVQVDITEEDKGIRVADDGTITVPAAACSRPTKSTGKIIFMESNLGGKQLHYSRVGKQQSFDYTFDAPQAGTYALTARIANPSWGQHLLVSPNGAKTPVDIELPLTKALWGETEPVKIPLKKGKNVLTFSRGGDNIRGLTIKDFTLKPVK